MPRGRILPATARKAASPGPAASCADVVEGLVREGKNGALLNLRVSPRSTSTALDGTYGGSALKIRVAAPPSDGRANAALEKFLAGLFGVASSSVEVVRGASGRDKVALVRGVEAGEIRRRISALIP
jgi:uncharacterized protein (TIGR00251 family)